VRTFVFAVLLLITLSYIGTILTRSWHYRGWWNTLLLQFAEKSKFQKSNAHSRIPLLANVNERPEITRDISHTFARDIGKIAGICGSRNIFSSRTNRLHVRVRTCAQLITRQTLAAVLPETFSPSHIFHEMKPKVELSSRRGRRLSERNWHSRARRHANFPVLIEPSCTVFSGATRRPTGPVKLRTKDTKRNSEGRIWWRKEAGVHFGKFDKSMSYACRENEENIVESIIVDNYWKVVGIIMRDRINRQNIVRVHQSIQLFLDPSSSPRKSSQHTRVKPSLRAFDQGFSNTKVVSCWPSTAVKSFEMKKEEERGKIKEKDCR